MITPAGNDPQVLALAKFSDGTQGVIMQDVDDVPNITALSISGVVGGPGTPALVGAASPSTRRSRAAL